MDILTVLVKQDYLNKAMFISSFIGVCIGVFTSFVVNATLVEISINTFFSLVLTLFKLSLSNISTMVSSSLLLAASLSTEQTNKILMKTLLMISEIAKLSYWPLLVS